MLKILKRLSSVFLIANLIAFVYGCGGGGGGGGSAFSPGFVPETVVSGKVTLPASLSADIRAQVGSSEVGVVGASVFLVSRPEIVVKTDQDGSFRLVVPNFNGETYRIVSHFALQNTELITISAAIRANQVSTPFQLQLEEGVNKVSGRVTDSVGKVVPNAMLELWGLRFYSGVDGTFTSPALPARVKNAVLSASAAGYSADSFNVLFGSYDVAPRMDIALRKVDEPNVAPMIQLSSADAKVSPGQEIPIEAYLQDTDEGDLSFFKPVWSATGGDFAGNSAQNSGTITFEGGSRDILSAIDLAAVGDLVKPVQIFKNAVTWKAPQEIGLATVSVSVRDSRGAFTSAALIFAVGGSTQSFIRVASMTPVQAPVNSEVQISGSGFGPVQSDGYVSFNGKKGNVLAWSDSLIRVSVPNQAESGLVLVYSAGQEKSAGYFTVLPSTVSFSPSYGPVGAVVTITGTDFGLTQSENKVFINNLEAEIVSWADTSIVTKIPAGAISGAVILQIGKNVRNLGNLAVSKAYNLNSYYSSKNGVLSVYGEGFGASIGNSTIKFSNSVAASVLSWSDTHLQFVVPAGAVTGTITANIGTVDLPLGLCNILSIESVSTDRGTIGQPVTITGTGFGASQGDSKVLFNGLEATASSWQENQIVALIPASGTPGALEIQVNDHKSNPISFTISAIHSISYSYGPAGTNVTIDGCGFGTSLGSISFGGEAATNYPIWGENKVVATVPDTATGSIDIAAEVAGVISNTKPFRVSWIASFSPDAGWIGRELYFEGVNFGNDVGASEVLFNNVKADVISWSDTFVKVRVPVGATTGELHVKINDGIINLEEFEVAEVQDYSLVAAWSGECIDSIPAISHAVIAPDGSYLVSDFENHWIWRYDSNRNYVGRIGRYGTGDGQFIRPWGIAFDSSQNIYISDSDNHRIQKFSFDGTFLGWLGYGADGSHGWHNPGSGIASTNGTANGEFKYPLGIAIGPNGNLFICDTLNNRIQEINPAGTHIRNFEKAPGAPVTSASDLKEPYGVFVDPSGNVWIADTGYNRIQVFDSTANVIAWYGLSQNSAEGLVHTAASGHLAVNNAGSGDGEFDAPRAVLIDKDSKLVVADSGNGRIQVFSNAGAFESSIGQPGGGRGQFDGLSSVVQFSNGDLLVSDQENYRIQSVSMADEFKWALSPDTGGLNAYPTGIAADSKLGRIYLVDMDNRMISQFDLNGNFQKFIGSEGAGKGQFYAPTDVAVDSSGNIYVADSGNARIQKFDSDGRYLLEWGSYGTGDGQFKGLKKIAINRTTGEVWAVDSTLDRIQKFTGSGQFLLKSGSTGAGDGQFSAPSGIAVSDDGYVYVADTFNSRVQKLDSFATFQGWWGYDDFGFNGWHPPGTGRTPQVDDAPGRFDSPEDVSVDSDGNVYVMDYGNYNIQKFKANQGEEPVQTINANYLGTIDANDNFLAIEVDAGGRVYATTEGKEIEVYDPDP